MAQTSSDDRIGIVKMRRYLSRLLESFRAGSHSLNDLGPLYHDFSVFGYVNQQKSGIFPLNQKSKAPIISAYIQWAIAKSRSQTSDDVSFAELFCADGYYAMLARHFGATSAIGLDNDRDNFLSDARAIAERLGIDNIQFIKEDVDRIDTLGKVDIVANVGGLYHVANPAEIIAKSYGLAKKYLIVQSVVSMADASPDYFETPAPGLTWGSRFNRASFDTMIDAFNYDVVDRHFNELEGNDRLEDRGSVYYLIRVREPAPEPRRLDD
jgi:hypothetical protein